MSALVPLIVSAKDEERSLPACLASLRRSRIEAERRGCRLLPLLAADDCRDTSAEIARAFGFGVVPTSGGKVEAQRAGLAAAARSGEALASFAIFSDADIVVEDATLGALIEAMAEPRVLVAFPDKLPLAPRRRSALARAIHTYNARRGFSTRRTWFSGKLFALRGWRVPDAAEVARRAAALPPDAFLELAAPLRVDDVYLSREVVARGGVSALAEVPSTIRYRAPETLLGMMHVYRRMTRELERTDALFPELREAGLRWGHRRYDALPRRPERALVDLAVFASALAVCKLAYRAEGALARRAGLRLPPWPKIEETRL